ncbi:MAG: hypothetical protein H6622_03165 [Halobacteriovoraceae bacterium]|nr:hypothetical protein [Halobacteriovoraceae bacterium]
MKKVIVKNKKLKTVVVIPRAQKDLAKSEYEIGLVNFITGLMEKDYIEKALALINLFFHKLSLPEKKQLVPNIIEATSQYEIHANMLPESYYDFLVSDESNELFF